MAGKPKYFDRVKSDDQCRQREGAGDDAFPGCALTADEIEFGKAMHQYKRRTGRLNPSYAEVLAVIHSLGYRKVVEPETPLVAE